MDNVDVLSNIIVFSLVAIIFILALFVYFKITLKNYDASDEKKVKFYGLFLGLDNKSIIAFSMITINFIYIAWLIVSFIDFNYIYAIISYVLVILSNILTKQYSKIFLNTLFNSGNILFCFLTNYVYNYFIEDNSIYLLIILALLIIFIFLYLLYITFKWLNEIIVCNKYLVKRKYKKL